VDWRKSATGHWVAYDGKNHYSVQSLACFDARNKPCRRYRLRVNTLAVGGEKPKLFVSAAAAKKYADSMKGEVR